MGSKFIDMTIVVFWVFSETFIMNQIMVNDSSETEEKIGLEEFLSFGQVLDKENIIEYLVSIKVTEVAIKRTLL